MSNKRRDDSRFGSRKRGATSSSGSESDVRRDVRPGAGGSADGLLSECLKYADFKVRPGGENSFSRRVGYFGHDIPWDGAFIDCVAYDAGVDVPSCVYTGSGLAEFSHSRRLYISPVAGDIVFYPFSARVSSRFQAPHCGIVVQVLKDDKFVACEGDVENSVQLIERWTRETIGFGRPNFNVRPGRTKNADGHLPKPVVSIARIQAGAFADIYNLQRALEIVSDLRYHRNGVYDEYTRAGYARWQRQIGYVGPDATGFPDPASLTRLGDRTKIFCT